MPVNNHITELIIKHLQDKITAEEANTLQQWIAADARNREQFESLTNPDALQAEMISDQRIQDQVYAQLPEVQEALTVVTPGNSWKRWAAVAAAAIILISVGAWYWWQNSKSKPVVTTVQKTPAAAPIPPGGNKATLTLADGTVVDLTKAANGAIATQGKTTVNKKEDGQLEYKRANSPLTADNSPAYNVLSTPRGGQYQLLLPDGSKVWLNAASSIKYPTAFIENERKVEITGEAYFEVAKDAYKPFRVAIKSDDGREGLIEVMGTHFNVNAYGDEQPIITTLLEGKVKISAEQQITNNKLLLPGDEARINDNAAITVKKNVDTESAVAWMKGFFDFHNAGIKSVMKQVSRWYAVDIQYDGPVPAQTFEGNLDRNISLNDLLDLLQRMGPTKFQLEGRVIKVK